jgi:predicted HTH transcriptional regulator
MQSSRFFFHSPAEAIKNIKANSKITRQELAGLIDMSVRGIDNNLSQLKSLRILTRIGPDKNGSWELHLIRFSL